MHARMRSRPRRPDAGQCALMNNLAEMVARQLEKEGEVARPLGLSATGRLADACMGRKQVVSQRFSCPHFRWILRHSTSVPSTSAPISSVPPAATVSTLPPTTQASAYRQLERSPEAFSKQSVALVDTRYPGWMLRCISGEWEKLTGRCKDVRREPALEWRGRAELVAFMDIKV